MARALHHEEHEVEDGGQERVRKGLFQADEQQRLRQDHGEHPQSQRHEAGDQRTEVQKVRHETQLQGQRALQRAVDRCGDGKD